MAGRTGSWDPVGEASQVQDDGGDSARHLPKRTSPLHLRLLRNHGKWTLSDGAG